MYVQFSSSIFFGYAIEKINVCRVWYLGNIHTVWLQELGKRWIIEARKQGGRRMRLDRTAQIPSS